jgi:hypothetical protein
MPFALLLIGAVLIITAIRGTYSDLGKQLTTDFTGSGSGSFLIWIAAIGAVGALGYSPVLRTPARMLLALVILAMVMTNGQRGLFSRLQQAVSTAPPAEPGIADQPLTGSVPVQLSGGSGASGASGAAGQAASAITSFLPLLAL